MPLIQLIYVSSATRELSDPELDDILQVSVRRNAEAGLTGMLIYADGNFMQVLEGEEAAVRAAYARIERDPRHHHALVIDDSPVEQRDFPAWHMGFRRLTDADRREHPGWAPFFLDGIDPARFGARPGLAREMLVTFSRR